MGAKNFVITSEKGFQEPYAFYFDVGLPLPL